MLTPSNRALFLVRLCSSLGQEHVAKSPPLKTGDIGKIVKRKPATLMDALKEAFTDSDGFTVDFANANLTAQQKALMLSSLVLVDYMFFEMDNGMLGCQGSKIKITCCLCYCCGNLNPCNVKLETRVNLRFIQRMLFP